MARNGFHSTPHAWTETGIYCELSGGNCIHCPAAVHGFASGAYSLLIDNYYYECHQKASNNKLKARGIQIDRLTKEYQYAKRLLDREIVVA